LGTTITKKDDTSFVPGAVFNICKAGLKVFAVELTAPPPYHPLHLFYHHNSIIKRVFDRFPCGFYSHTLRFSKLIQAVPLSSAGGNINSITRQAGSSIAIKAVLPARVFYLQNTGLLIPINQYPTMQHIL